MVELRPAKQMPYGNVFGEEKHIWRFALLHSIFAVHSGDFRIVLNATGDLVLSTRLRFNGKKINKPPITDFIDLRLNSATESELYSRQTNITDYVQPTNGCKV